MVAGRKSATSARLLVSRPLSASNVTSANAQHATLGRGKPGLMIPRQGNTQKIKKVKKRRKRKKTKK